MHIFFMYSAYFIWSAPSKSVMRLKTRRISAKCRHIIANYKCYIFRYNNILFTIQEIDPLNYTIKALTNDGKEYTFYASNNTNVSALSLQLIYSTAFARVSVIQLNN